MKLISSTEFVLGQSEKYLKGFIALNEYHSITLNYANFLKQSLTLGMFIPVDEEGNVLEERNQFLSCGKGLEYAKAKLKVLFELNPIFEHYTDCLILEITNNGLCILYNKLENSFQISNYTQQFNVTLTETAIKMIYG